MENDSVKLKKKWPLWVKIGLFFTVFLILINLYFYAWLQANSFDSSTGQFAWPEWARSIFDPHSELLDYTMLFLMVFLGPLTLFFGVPLYFIFGTVISFIIQKLKTRKTVQ